MSAANQTEAMAMLHRAVQENGIYPIEAYQFVSAGLAFTAMRIHGEPVKQVDAKGRRMVEKCRHVSGQQLCKGLRVFALRQYGLLARTVLARWNITSTMDFGRIVFCMADHKMMAVTASDSIEDFRNVYDFKTGFEAGYRFGRRLETEKGEGALLAARKP